MGGRGSGSNMRSSSSIKGGSLAAKYSQSDINQASNNATIQQLGEGNERMTVSLGNDYSVSINITRVEGGYKVDGSNTVFPYITGARNSARSSLHHNLMKATGRA